MLRGAGDRVLLVFVPETYVRINAVRKWSLTPLNPVVFQAGDGLGMMLAELCRLLILCLW